MNTALFLLQSAEGEAAAALPVAPTAAVVLVASLLITVGWLAHLYS
ncbi:hypothetical protein [Candidatus Halobonum tyrrellensis]|nr:hypothetical protein [Candidatus Halobonum tyrrellensis]